MTRNSYAAVVLAGLATVVVAAVLFMATADDGDDGALPGLGALTGGPEPTLQAFPAGDGTGVPGVSEDERERALATLADSADFAQATRGRTWHVVSEHPNTRDGEKVGIALILELESPLDSDGPWFATHCQGTVSQRFTFPYQGFSQLAAVFDDTGALVALRPIPDFSVPGGTPSLGFASDAPTVAAPECPKGFEDEEN